MLVANSTTQSRELLRFAQRSVAEQNWDITFVLTGSTTWSGAQDIKEFAEKYCLRNVVDWRQPPTLDRVKKNFGSKLQSVIKFVVSHKAEKQKYRTHFEENRYSLLLVCEDGLGGPIPLLAEARKRNIPSAILPYEYSTKESIFKSLSPTSEIRKVRGVLEWTVSMLFPSWVEDFSGEKYLRLSPAQILYREITGLSIPRPWTVHGGHASLLLAESDFMKNHYLREGVPHDKIRKTGSLVHDELAKIKISRTDFRKKTKSHPEMMRVAVSLPPSYFPSLNKAVEFPTYSDLIIAWVKVMSGQKGITVTYQAHPHTNSSDLEIICELVELSDEPIVEIISDCDLLITSYSSIIRMALVLGKPVINFDVYGFDFPDYKNVTGVTEISRMKDLDKSISEILEAATYPQLTKVLSERAGEWGWLDGNSWPRVQSSLEQLQEDYIGRRNSTD
jgi:hypothetical protein